MIKYENNKDTCTDMVVRNENEYKSIIFISNANSIDNKQNNMIKKMKASQNSK